MNTASQQQHLSFGEQFVRYINDPAQRRRVNRKRCALLLMQRKARYLGAGPAGRCAAMQTVKDTLAAQRKTWGCEYPLDAIRYGVVVAADYADDPCSC
jgi:hypothetical protein